MSESALKFHSLEQPVADGERRSDLARRTRYAVLNKLLTDCYRPITRDQRRALIQQAINDIAVLEREEIA